jgi:hypothetical protein
MVESKALLVDDFLSRQSLRLWLLSMSFQLCFLLAARPVIIGRAFGIVTRAIAAHLIRKAGRKGNGLAMATTVPGFRGDSEANGRSVPVDLRKRGVYSSYTVCLRFDYLKLFCFTDSGKKIFRALVTLLLIVVRHDDRTEH